MWVIARRYWTVICLGMLMVLQISCGESNSSSAPPISCDADLNDCPDGFACEMSASGAYECVDNRNQGGNVGSGGSIGEGGVEVSCTGASDGVIITEGTFGACEYTDICSQTGTKRRTDRVCMAESPTDVLVESEEGCARDTTDVTVSEGSFSECEGFSDICDLDAQRSRVDQVCTNGVATEVPIVEDCTRDPVGVLETMDSASACLDMNGGMISLGAARVIVPADALTEPTVISLFDAGAQTIEGYSTYSNTYRIEGGAERPSLAFSLSLPFDGNTDNAVLFWQENDAYERLPGALSDGILTAEIANFGQGFVGDGIHVRPEANRDCVRLKTLESQVTDPGIVGLVFAAADCAGNPIIGLTNDDFEVTEETLPLATTSGKKLVATDGLQAFVTLLLDMSSGSTNEIAAIKAAAEAFVSDLQTNQAVPVQIAIELFAGGDNRNIDNVVHSETWQQHFLDTQTLVGKINTIETFQGPSPTRSDLNGAIISSLSKLSDAASAFRNRNRGGASTAEYLVVFASGQDSARFYTDEETRAAADVSSAEIMGVIRPTATFSSENLVELTGGDVFSSLTAEDLTRDLKSIAVRISAKLEGTYAMAYCTPSANGSVTSEVSISNATNEATAIFTFNATGLIGCSDIAAIDARCESKACGGLGCGFCPDENSICSENGQCVSYCLTDAVDAETAIDLRCDYPNPRGYPQYCEQAISTLCDGTCTDLSSDPANCGSCGFDCGPNVLGAVNGASEIGTSCQNNICQCAAGWSGPRCDEAVCGDGLIRGSENCDDGVGPDGNPISTDGCSETCETETFWSCAGEPSQCDGILGDGVKRGTEQCDDGVNPVSGAPEDGDGCSASGLVERFWRCDGEPSVCDGIRGDERVLGTEACDDGSDATTGTPMNGDGCSALGTVEAGWTCDANEPSVCDGVRGDGQIRGTEACDNGVNAETLLPEAGDGCSINGEVELGFTCLGEPSACTTNCGDGISAGLEQCDDANQSNLDGCSNNCFILSSGLCQDNCDAVGTVTRAFANNEFKLFPSLSGAGDRFGASVAVKANRAIIGAPDGSLENGNSGMAYVFEKQGAGAWREAARIEASDGEFRDGFGSSVAIDGDTAIIGALSDDARAINGGSVYVFERTANGWSETGRINASDGRSNDRFGLSVSLSGDTALVGTPFKNANRGGAYLFQRQPNGSWRETILSASDAATNDYFGQTVSIDGNVAVVGAYGDNTGRGSAYVFERQHSGEWTQTRKLIGSDTQLTDNFGVSVSNAENRIIVGAVSHDLGELADAGAAYMFERQNDGSWFESKLVASNGAVQARFGGSVSISGDVIAVGAFGDSGSAESSGSVYLFERNTNGGWRETKITASDGVAYDGFGGSVAVSERTVIIGADGSDQLGENSGTTYIFSESFQCFSEANGAAACLCREGASGADCNARPDLGNGLVEGVEECDDENSLDGDGCSASAVVERGYTCEGEPSDCFARCGDGITTNIETCDDGNAISGDGCSAICVSEPGYTCLGEPSVCLLCRSDDECPVDEQCINNRCIGCEVDSDCSGAAICVDERCLERAQNTSCIAPNPYEIGKVILGDIGNWIGSYGGSCANNTLDRPETVFEFVAEETGEVCVSLKDSNFDSLLYVREAPGSCDSGNPNARTCRSYCEDATSESRTCGDDAGRNCCNDNTRLFTESGDAALTLQVTEGKRYFLFVDRVSTQSAQSETTFKMASSYGSCDSQLPLDCDNEDDCAQGLECLGGECTVRCDSSGSGLCPERLQSCEANICRAIDCLNEQECFPGFCQLGDLPSENRCIQCRDEGDCENNELCIDNICRECATDAHCTERNPSGQEFYCVESRCARCRVDAHCPLGVCDDSGVCVECTDNSMCASGVCNDRRCVECNLASDCLSGFGCRFDGVCRQCAVDGDCSNGLRCNSDTGICHECVANADCNLGEECFQNSCEEASPNGTCLQPTPLQIGINEVGNTEQALSLHQSNTSMMDDCSGNDGSGPESVYAFTSDRTGFACFSTDGSSFDTVLHVRGPICGDPNGQVVCDDDGGESVRSKLSVPVTAGETYHVFVDGYRSTSRGSFILRSGYSETGDCELSNVCDSDDECPSGETCLNNRCGCPSHDACNFDELCLDENRIEILPESNRVGSCERIECSEDLHCGEAACEDFLCIECRADNECASDELCNRDFRCERTFLCLDENAPPSNCVQNEECGPFGICDPLTNLCERNLNCDVSLDLQGNPAQPCLPFEICELFNPASGDGLGQCVFRGGCRDDEFCDRPADLPSWEPGECAPIECRSNDECQLPIAPICETNFYRCVECVVGEDCREEGSACFENRCITAPECGAEGQPPCANGGDCIDGTCVAPAGTCESPTNLANGSVQGSTLGQASVSISAPGCGFGNTSVGNGPEAVFAYRASALVPIEVCANTLDSTVDTVLYVRAGNCFDSAAQVACNDDAPDSPQGTLSSAVQFIAEPGVQYYIFVDSYGRNGNNFILNIAPCE